MKTGLYATLEKAIERWLNDHCEDDEWPDSYIYEDQSKDMAKAVELVFDANVKGQKFAKKEA